MLSSKNVAILFSAILFLAVGIIIGYYSNNNKFCGAGSPNSANYPAIGSPVAKMNITAKEALSIAKPAVFLWAEDAYLAEIDLVSGKLKADGSGNGWKVIFYSEKKNKTYEIIIKDGESRGGQERIADSPMQTLKGEMADSAALAKSFYGAYPADTEIIGLKMYYDGGSKKFLWTIFFPKGSHTINAEI